MEWEAMDIKEDKHTQWDTANLHDFWREIADRNRVIQFYEDEKSFILTLEGFVGSGLLAGFSVIIIATREHLDQLLFRLQQQSLSIPDFIESGHYIPLDVADVIKTITPGGVLDTAVFYEVISKSVEAVSKQNRHCYIFTEIAAMLLQSGYVNAAADLTRCWESLHNEFQFTLFRAMPGELADQPIAIDSPGPSRGHNILINGYIGSPTEISFRKLSA